MLIDPTLAQFINKSLANTKLVIAFYEAKIENGDRLSDTYAAYNRVKAEYTICQRVWLILTNNGSRQQAWEAMSACEQIWCRYLIDHARLMEWRSENPLREDDFYYSAQLLLESRERELDKLR